jgi:hypothetical protein
MKVLHTGRLAFEPTLGFTDQKTLLLQGYDAPRGDVPLGWDATGVVWRTRDGGRTWEDVSPSTPEERREEYSGDPYLYVDPTTSRAFTVNYQIGTCSTISWTDDGGKTWADGNPVGCGLGDHQNLFAGPPRTSEPAGYPNVVYYCAIGGFTFASAAAGCQRSLDGGQTFHPVGAPFVSDPTKHRDGGFDVPGNCTGAVAPGVVGPDGTVYVPSGQCGQPWLAISEDEGLTWKQVQVATSGMGQGDEAFFADGSSERSFASHESGVAVDDLGNVYYTWVARDHVAYLVVKRAGEEAFGLPTRVSPAKLTDATLPAIAVGDPGHLAIAYVGSENAPPARMCPGDSFTCEITPGIEEYYRGSTWNGYVTVTTEALVADPTFLTGTANDPRDPLERGFCGQGRCGALGDFFDVTIGPDGRAWAAFADHCPAGAETCDGAVYASAYGIVAHMVTGPKLR